MKKSKNPKKRTIALAEMLFDNSDFHEDGVHGRTTVWDSAVNEGSITAFRDKYLKSLQNKFTAERVNFIKKELEKNGYRSI